MRTLKCLVAPFVALIIAAGIALAGETTPVRLPEGGAWGKPADGLAVGIVLPENEWEYGKEPPILVYVRNDAPVSLRLISLDTHTNTTFGHYHNFHFSYQKEGEQRVQHAFLDVPIGSSDKLTELKPGEIRLVRFTTVNARADGTYVDWRSPLYAAFKREGWFQINAWPPTPGRYKVHATLGAKGDLTKAKAAGLWTASAQSESVDLVVKPYPFLQQVPEDPKVTVEEIEMLYLRAADGREEAIRKLTELDDRRAALALFKLTRNEKGDRQIVPLLARKFGDEITYDLVRAARADGMAKEAAFALGQLGTPKVIEAVQKLLTAKAPLWVARDSFVRGLGESKTSDSLVLLAKLALEGDQQAVIVLTGRSEEKTLELLREVMQKGKPLADAEAARRLAARGQIDAVRWLAAHWDWLGAAAFVKAPIQWPAPGKTELTAAEALSAAQQAARQLRKTPLDRPSLPNPEARYLDGRWYVVSVAGHPGMRGHFVYVILDAGNGKVVANDAHWVLR